MTTPRDEGISSLFDDELDNQVLGDNQAKNQVEHGTDTDQQTEQVLDQLCRETECKQRWSRYQIIHDTLQRHLPPAIDPDFSSRVMAAIESDPTVLAPPISDTNPSPENSENHHRNHSSVSYISDFMNTALNKKLGKRVAGFAVAASVTAISVLSFQYNYQQQSTGQFDVSAANNANMMASSKVVALDEVKRAGQITVPYSPAQIAAGHRNHSVNTVSASKLNANSLSTTLSGSNTIAKPSVALAVKKRAPLLSNVSITDPAISAHLRKYLINHSQNVSGTRLQSVMPYARIVTDSRMLAIQKNPQQ